MGTPAIITFMDDNQPAANVYLQSDGYPSWAGYRLGQWLEKFTVGNGAPLGAKMGQYANGMGCLAAQYIAHVKDRVGGVYMIADDSGWVADYCYTVECNADKRLVISCYSPGEEDKAITLDPKSFQKWASGRD